MRMKKKYVRWILWVIASPFILLFVIGILLYLPPVQNFVLDKAMVYASEATGMNINVGHISLSFPLKLVVEDVDATSEQNDTLLSLKRLQVRVQMLPLLRKQVEVDAISVEGVTVDTQDLMDGMTLKGTLGEFFLSSHGVALDPELAIVNKVLLKDTDLYLCMNDTTAADTTATDTVYWKFILKDIDLQNVSFAMDMPLDTLSMAVSLDEALLRNGSVDLHKSAYFLETFQIKNGRVKYDGAVEPDSIPSDSLPKGLDTSHILLTDVDVKLDSLYYEGMNMNAIISEFALKEQSGLQIVSTEGSLSSNEKVLRVPSLRMATLDSYMELNASMDWSALETKGDGLISARLMADIGKTDVMMFVSDMGEEFVQQYPSEPLRIRAGIDGNLNQMKLTTLSAELPSALSLYAKGELTLLMDSLHRGSDLTLEVETKDMKFVSALAEGVEIPYGTRLDGKLTMAGSKLGTDLLLRQPHAHAESASDTIPETVAHTDSISVSEDFKMGRAARVYAQYDLANDGYEVELAVNELDLHQFMPNDSLYTLTTHLKIDGEGFDFLSPQTSLNIDGSVDRFKYGNYDLSGITLTGGLNQSKLDMLLAAQNDAMDMKLQVDGTLKETDIATDVDLNVGFLDWYALQLVEKPFKTSQDIHISLSTDMGKRHKIRGSMTNSYVTTDAKTIQTKDLRIGFATSTDSTHVFVRAGDLVFLVEGKGGLEDLSNQADVLMTQFMEQWETRNVQQAELRKLFPGVDLKVKSGAENPVANYLSMMGMGYDKMHVDMTASAAEGLVGEAYLYGLRMDSLELDTIFLNMRHDVDGIVLTSGVISNAKPRQEAFDIELEGSIGDNTGQIIVKYLNAQKEVGVNMGVKADLRRRGIRMQLVPEEPTLLYRPFSVNADNFIYLADNGRIHARVDLHDDHGTGLKFYTNRSDSLNPRKQDMTVELSRINLKEFGHIIPFMPDMEGWVGGKAHYAEADDDIMVSADINMEKFKYEGSEMGDWKLGCDYRPGEGKEYTVDAYVQQNESEILKLGGILLPPDEEGKGGGLSAEMNLKHFPLDVANPFVPDHMVVLGGDLDGTMAVKGDPSRPIINGDVALDSVSFFMPDFAVTFRVDDQKMKVKDSKLTFDKFDVHTKGETPFTINGNVDFSNLDRMMVDLSMRAENYELLNAKRDKRTMLYGKMYVDFNAMVKGPVDELVMRGNMNVLGKTDFTYIMKDSPIEVTDRLGEMVTFVDFNDTISVEEEAVQQISLGGMDIAMTLHIDQSVQARVDLVEDGSNYMLLEGGGDLSFQYTPRGDMLLTGRYSLISGELKYEIPIIPLKTFSIQNGSYVEWTGDIWNPSLSIVATERVRASVGEEGQTARMVGFDVGLSLSQTLENLGMAFTIASPEDASVQEQLDSYSVEDKGKLAITMLVTGMYVAEGNTAGSFSMNNALNTFLQNEISNIAGQTMDISLGVESVDDGEGGTRTDYNFQFAKRLWNNRVRIVIGGTVSSGGNADQQDDTFIDNVSLEYRLDTSGTRYVKFFHNKNYESVLEGEITETGVGIILQKKVSKLGELFIFKKKKKKQENPPAQKEGVV